MGYLFQRMILKLISVYNDFPFQRNSSGSDESSDSSAGESEDETEFKRVTRRSSVAAPTAELPVHKTRRSTAAGMT